MELSDPLEKYGLSPVEFNKVLAEYEDDPAVHEAVASLMGAPPTGAAATTEAGLGDGIHLMKVVDMTYD